MAVAIAYTQAKLTTVGSNQLRGRIRDGLKSDSGLWPLYLELTTATVLIKFTDAIGIDGRTMFTGTVDGNRLRFVRSSG